MHDQLNLSVAQNPAELDGPGQRMTWLRHTLQQLDHSVELLVLPELFLCGYNIAGDVNSWAETADGPSAHTIAALARQYETAIHYSYAERDGNHVFNASQCFGSRGERLVRHRKLALPPGFEMDHFSPGSGCELFLFNGFKVATLICYDAEFPEAVRHVCSQGADLVIVPTALAQQWAVVAEHVIHSRAFENGCYLAYANQSGTEHGLQYYGGSRIVSPQGQALAKADTSPQILHATLQLDQVKAARNRLPYLIDHKKLQL